MAAVNCTAGLKRLASRQLRWGPSINPGSATGSATGSARSNGSSRRSADSHAAGGSTVGELRNNELMAQLFGRRNSGFVPERQSLTLSAWQRCHRCSLPVIDPLSHRRMVWELAVSALIVWSAIEIPFSVAFLDTTPVLDVVDGVIDSVMVVDVFSTFFVGYVDEDDQVTFDRRAIARHYLLGWFAVDLIASLPINAIIQAATDTENSVARVVRMLRTVKLLRLLRLLKLFRYFRRWEDDLASKNAWKQILLMLCGLLIVMHINACILFLVPALQDFPPDSWVSYSSSSPPHAIALPLAELPSVEATVVCYSHSFFCALSHMLSIGYGLGLPQRLEEMWTTIFTMLNGATMYALCLAYTVNIISATDHPSRMYKNGLELLNEYMRVRCLPKPLRERLRRTYAHLYPNKRIFSERAVLGELGYPMRNEIRVAQCSALFARAPIFRDASGAFLSSVAARLEIEIALPDDWLAREGEALRHVVFIESGLVEVLVGDLHVAEMGDGAHLGEISALGVSEPWGAAAAPGLATASVLAKSVCALHVLSHAHFRHLMGLFPQVHKAMLVVAKLRLKRASAATPAGKAASSRPDRSDSLTQIEGLTADDVSSYAARAQLERMAARQRVAAETARGAPPDTLASEPSALGTISASSDGDSSPTSEPTAAAAGLARTSNGFLRTVPRLRVPRARLSVTVARPCSDRPSASLSPVPPLPTTSTSFCTSSASQSESPGSSSPSTVSRSAAV